MYVYVINSIDQVGTDPSRYGLLAPKCPTGREKHIHPKYPYLAPRARQVHIFSQNALLAERSAFANKNPYLAPTTPAGTYF